MSGKNSISNNLEKSYPNPLYKNIKEKEIKKGFLTYNTLSGYVGDMILCHNLYITRRHKWQLISGNMFTEDGDIKDVFQTFVVSKEGANYLHTHSDEPVFYDEELDLYIWAITFYGEDWSDVFSNATIKNE